MSGSGQITVVVEILGKDYRIACKAEEKDALLKSARYLSEKVNQIKNSGRVVGSEKIAVMAALNIAHELLDLKESDAVKSEVLRKRLSSIKERVDTTLDKCAQLEM